MSALPSGASDRLLEPAEATGLQRVLAGPSRSWVPVAVLAVLLSLLPTAVYLVTDGGRYSFGGNHWDHLLGRTEQVTAQVDAAELVGHCGRESENRDQFRIEVSWTAGPPPGHSAYLVCNSAPGAGESVQLWVDSGGHVLHKSPSAVRLTVTGIGLGLAALTIALAAVMLVPARRRQPRLLAAAASVLRPSVPVLVRPHGCRKLGFHISPAPQVVGAGAPTPAIPIVAAAAGEPLEINTVGKVKGAWQFRAGPVSARGRQLGVLERGAERCWVETRSVRR